MHTLTIPGGWYADCLPSGQYVALVAGSHLETDTGQVDFLPGATPTANQSLFVRLRDDGLAFAGQAHADGAVVEYRNGAWSKGRIAIGVSPIIYDASGTLHISDGSIGSQGWRYVAPDGRLVTGDETYAPGPGFTLYEWTDLSRDGDTLIIGQGPEGGCHVWDGTTHRVVAEGTCRFIRAHRVGDDVSVAIWRPGAPTLLLWATVEELRALPPVLRPIIAPPIADKSIVGAFFVNADTPGNVAVWVRRYGQPMFMPPTQAILAEVELATRVPPDRLLGVWVAEGPATTLGARITQSRAKAAALRVPLVIYVDDRDYHARLPEIVAAVGDTPWIAHVQCYIDRHVTLVETVEAFAASVAAHIAGLPVPWIAAVRCTTGTGTIPPEKVIAAMNALVPVVTGPRCLGWTLFAWDRPDGVTGVSTLELAARTWTTGTPQLVPTNARAWAATFFPKETPTMRLPSPVLTTVQQFAAAFPIPRGDGGEAWIESALRQGWTKRMVEQVVFSHGPTWGRKAQSSSHPVSKEALALNDGGLHVWDLLVGASSGRPTLATDPAYHFVPEQLFIPVPGVDHLGSIAPPTDRPTIAAPLWGIDSFDLGVRVQAGDTRWITEVMVPNGLAGRTVCASRFRSPRTLYQGLVQTDLACAALRAAKGRSEFVLLCDTAEYGLTRADALAQVTALDAIFLRYPEVVAGLQIGNENSHGVEQPYMSDPDFLAEAEARIDRRFPVAWGAGHGGEGVSMAGGSYLVHHPDRELSPAANGLIMAEAQRIAKRPVLNSEDLGVAETARVPGRQRTDAVRFFERVVDVAKRHRLGGVTWHGDAGMTANVDDLGPIQRESIARFVAAAGSIVVPPSPGHPLLDSPLTYAFFIAHWREVLVEAAAWYTRATGTPPADPDLGHMLYRAFEEQARPAPRWTTLRAAWSEDKPGGAPR